MTTEKIKEFVYNSDLPQIQKNVMNVYIDKAKEVQEKKLEYRQLIEKVANEKQISEVILSTDEVIIYTVNSKHKFDIKYPFRSMYLSNNKDWIRIDIASPNLDVAYLVYLQYKYLDINSQFVDFAVKMLEIPNVN